MTAARYSEEERRAKRTERLALLDRAVEELTSSDAWASWLKVRRSFHSYSWRNQLMISVQRPTTLAVAGLRQWHDRGRHVRQGSKAIWILAPAPFRTGDTDDRGEEIRKLYFKPVAVFAYEDTDQIEGLPEYRVEPPLADLEGDSHETELRRLTGWLQSKGVTVVDDHEPGSAHGWFLPPSTIGLAARLSPNARLKTLVHEGAHWLTRQGAEKRKWSYAEEEVVVESTAYAVCSSIGLETAGYSAGYVAVWRDGGPQPQDLVAAVDQLASELEEAIGVPAS